MESATEWYRHSKADAVRVQGSSLEQGLSHEEVRDRAEKFGANLLEDFKRRSGFRIFLSQFANLLVLVLIVAAAIASFVGERQDSIVIGAIVLLNAFIGFFQEYRAERTMEALKKLAAPVAKVLRMGQIQVISSHELVPGDIVFLEAGNVVPADLRILESHQFDVDESMLTGESVPITKTHEALEGRSIPIADQINMAFKGTRVTKGRARGLVVGIGAFTELGKIAKLIKEEVEVKTPLQRKIADFAKIISALVVLICVVIYIVGLNRGEDPWLMLMTSLSLAVAAIPEALPAVVAVALAIGARIMATKNSLVRKLSAVEALGAVTCICSDKTGTLTENQMQITKTFFANKIYEGIPQNHSTNEQWDFFVKALLLSNDVVKTSEGGWQGDPTEIALLEAALPFFSDKMAVEKAMPRVGEVPFSSERGMMSTLHQFEEGRVLFVKGAPEKVIPLCKNIQSEILSPVAEQLAGEGLRVLAISYRVISEVGETRDFEELEKDLTFLGFVGMMDPPRPEASEAISLCRSAGIRVVMITGDHPSTAKKIAQILNILEPHRSQVLTGKELLSIGDDELLEIVKETAVFARVEPEQKIRIVKALQANHEIVAMTGDGVNDAPALRRADVGISMGGSGTDVAREASHIILLDDNFATIVTAVREGRRIYDNIRKFIKFALSGNSGEIWTLFVAPILGLPIPLLPIHILWVNLVTDGLPGLALGLEAEEGNVMTRSPRSPKETLFGQGLWQHCLWAGVLTAGATLGVLAWAYHTERSHWQSMAFTVLTFTQMGHVLAIRNETESFFRSQRAPNFYLYGAVFITFALQLCVLYLPSLNSIFKTEPLTGYELLLCVAASSIVFVAVELDKWRKRIYK